MRMTPRAVSARELTRLMAGLTREEARRPAPKTREEKQRGTTMHPQDYPRDRPAFRRDGGGAGGGGGGGEWRGRGRRGGVQDEESHTGPRRVSNLSSPSTTITNNRSSLTARRERLRRLSGTPSPA